MKCPFCLSDIDDAALVCRYCQRDVYLYRSLLDRIQALEQQLASTAIPHAGPQEELGLAGIEGSQGDRPVASAARLRKATTYFIAPWALLLAVHVLIVIFWDLRLAYLRIACVLIPAAFAYRLFARHRPRLLSWIAAYAVLAGLAVISMSWANSVYDASPVLPQDRADWVEFVQFAASIFFSCLTGVILGCSEVARGGHSLQGSSSGTPALVRIGATLKTMQEYGSTAVALGTTLMSLYTGLKGVL